MDYKEIVETVKGWDSFKTFIGLIFLFTAGYLWINYFLPIKEAFPKFLFDHGTYYISLLGVIFLFIFGFWSFLTGMS